MKKYSILASLIVTFGLIGTQAQAETITVGQNHTADYPVIQTAVNFAVDGDIIEIEEGTYSETIIIPQGLDITMTGNVSDNTDVVIKGSVTINRRADLELQYLTINANGEPYGIWMKPSAYGNLKELVVHQAKHNVIVSKAATAELLDTVVRQATRHGILVKAKASFSANGLHAHHNAKAGVRANRVSYFSVTESQIHDNRYGVIMYKATTDNTVSKTTFTSNEVALKLIDATVELDSNHFVDNTTNKVEE